MKKTDLLALAILASIFNSQLSAQEVENYPDLDVLTMVQAYEDKLDAYTPPFDKAAVVKMMTPALLKAGYTKARIKKLTFGSGQIGKNRTVVVAYTTGGQEQTTNFYIADVKDGQMQKPVLCSAFFYRSEIEITQKCKKCGWNKIFISCMRTFTEPKMTPFLVGVWNKTQSEAPESEKQTLPLIIRLFD